MINVLITGATGFLGQALVRELMERDTDRICIYSRDEAKQAAMRARIDDPEESLRWFVGDVRDRRRLTRAMDGVDTVIHAAALKRIETGEYNPTELVKTNVLGTMNVIEACFDGAYGYPPVTLPRRMVYVSSDKACQARNAYGASKLMGEKLVLGAQNTRGKYGPTFDVVRYGNVAGSTGSVIPTWRAALANNADTYITEPDATRYWMSLQEAVGLVMRVAEQGTGGGLYTPTLPAYRLGDLAAAMDLPRPIEVRGLGPGEKLHERMLEDGPTSEDARRMTIEELKQALQRV
jgi:UDP-N-acetylglucosamine 4,6-dehydratase/5-epimerase